MLYLGIKYNTNLFDLIFVMLFVHKRIYLFDWSWMSSKIDQVLFNDDQIGT
jgi:hypothetical protein